MLKFFILFPNFKLCFIVVVLVIFFFAHSNRCSFTKNGIRRAPMGTIRRPLGYGGWGTEATALIQCINGQYPQIKELWCLDVGGICRKVHTTARVEVLYGTAG